MTSAGVSDFSAAGNSGDHHAWDSAVHLPNEFRDGGFPFVPHGRVVTTELVFRGARTDGSTFYGSVQNNLGRGWTTIDG